MGNTEVIIYSTPTCPDCRDAKRFFDEHHIPFTEYDIEKQPEKMDELVQLTGKHIVPTIKIGKEIFIGFNIGDNREKIERLVSFVTKPESLVHFLEKSQARSDCQRR